MANLSVGAMPRWSIALGAALSVTFLVTLMMQGLISSGGSVIEEDTTGRLVEFIHVKQDEDLQTKNRKPNKPPVSKVEPPKPKMKKPSMNTALGNDLNFAALDISTDLSIDSGLTQSGGDGEYLPIVKVAPQYPRRAAQKGIEGYVVVEFTVNKLGAVQDVIVIESQPANIFNRAAISAAKKFKYKPKINEGIATAVLGVRNIIRFELDKTSKRRG